MIKSPPSPISKVLSVTGLTKGDWERQTLLSIRVPVLLFFILNPVLKTYLIPGYQAKDDQEDPRSARQGQVEAGLLGQDVGAEGEALLCWDGDWALECPD
jgi:hypothetical protein